MLDRVCDDWECPSRWSCGLFIARQVEYWRCESSFIEVTPLHVAKRETGAENCAAYEHDRRKHWLAKILFPDNAPRAMLFGPPNGWGERNWYA